MGNSAGSETKDKGQQKQQNNKTNRTKVKFAPNPKSNRINNKKILEKTNNKLKSSLKQNQKENNRERDQTKFKGKNGSVQKEHNKEKNEPLPKENNKEHNGPLKKVHNKEKNGPLQKENNKEKAQKAKPKPKPKRKVKRGDQPPPTPPKLTREDLIGDLDFTIIDEHALKAPNDLLIKSYWDLVKYLTDDYAWNDMCRVRAIYKWITSYKIKSIPIDGAPPTNSPLEYFSKIQCDMGNYANLFYILCQLADVPCVIIDGKAKSSGYRIGEKINKKRTKAQWNAVLIEGEWRLMDLFWASTCVELNSGDAKKIKKNKNVPNDAINENTKLNSDEDESKPVIVNGKEIVPDKGPGDLEADESDKTNEKETEVRNTKAKSKTNKKIDMKKLRQIKHTEDADDCYFFTNPHDLLWTHLPDEEDWQLVENPMSFFEFEKRVYVRERLYELGMDIEGKHNAQCKHRTKQGKVSLQLNLPRRWASKLAFRNNFYRSKSTPYCKEDDDGSLEHCIEWEVIGDVLYYEINIPVYGQFRLDIFGRNPLLREVREFDLLCSYIIYCPMPPKIVIPLPDDPEIGWGQNENSDKAGLKPITHKKPKLGSDGGVIEMKFQGLKNLNVNVRLKHRNLDEGTLSRYAAIRWVDGEYILNLRLPQEGYYALKLYGKATEHGKTNLLNYLIRCKRNKEMKDDPFPVFTNNMLGESVLAKSLGIRILDKDNGITTANKGRGKVHFCTESEDPLMYEIHSNDKDAMSRVNMITKKEHGILSVHYILPVAGEYVLSVFTHKNNDVSKLYTVYTSIIQSTGSVGDSVFTPRTQIGDNKGFWDGKHDIPVDTIETTEKEVYLPHPKSPYDVLAYLDTNQGNGPQKGSAIEKIERHGETLFKISLPDINYCVANVYERKDGCFIKTIHRYFIVVPVDENDDENSENIEEIFPVPISSRDDMDKDEIIERNNEFMRKKMKEAEFYKDPDVLKNIVAKVEEGDNDFDENMVSRVKTLAKKLEARQALLDAYESRNIQDVENAISMAKAADVDGKLHFEIMHSTRLLQRLKILHRLRETIVDPDGRAIGESRKYANPPLPVKHALMSTLVLLGFPYYVVEDWTTTQRILWKMDEDSIQNKMARFDPRMAPLESALDAKMIIEQYTLDYMKTVSPLGTAFYVWNTQMIQEIESTAGTLGGNSEVYHDNEVTSSHYKDEISTEQDGNTTQDGSTTQNDDSVVTGIGNVSSNKDMPPVNNPPVHSQMKNPNKKNVNQQTQIISVSSTPNDENEN